MVSIFINILTYCLNIWIRHPHPLCYLNIVYFIAETLDCINIIRFQPTNDILWYFDPQIIIFLALFPKVFGLSLRQVSIHPPSQIWVYCSWGCLATVTRCLPLWLCLRWFYLWAHISLIMTHPLNRHMLSHSQTDINRSVFFLYEFCWTHMNVQPCSHPPSVMIKNDQTNIWENKTA